MKSNKTLLITLPLMLALLGVIVYRYGYVKVQSDLASIREQQDVKAMTLAKYTALLDERPAIEKRITSLKEEQKADESKLVEGQTPALAAAALQNIIRNVIVSRGGTISSERVGKPEDAGKFRAVNITIDAVFPDARALGDALYAVETSTPHLVVKELDSRVRNIREPKELMVKIEIAALTRGK